jgi:hypothetical protein
MKGVIMPGFLERHSQNALLGTMIASVLALIGSIVSVFVTIHYGNVIQDRQIRLEQVSKFDQSSIQIIEAGGSFISAINDNKSLAPAKDKLSAVLAAQINETDNITKFFGQRAKRKAEQYQSALEELNQVAQKTSGVTEMRPWAESFGRALDAKSILSQELYGQLGIVVKQGARSG